MDGRRIVFVLDNDVGLLEPLLQFAYLELVAAGDVATLAAIIVGVISVAIRSKGSCHARHHVWVGQPRQFIVQNRGIVLHCFTNIDNPGEYFVLDVDQGQGLLGYMRAGRRHCGYGVPFIKHLVLGQAIVADEAHVQMATLRNVHGQARNLGKPRPGNHGLHAGPGQRPAGIDGLNTGVGVRAPEHLAVEQTRQVDVSPIAGPASHLIGAVVTDGPGAHHIELLGG